MKKTKRERIEWTEKEKEERNNSRCARRVAYLHDYYCELKRVVLKKAS